DELFEHDSPAAVPQLFDLRLVGFRVLFIRTPLERHRRRTVLARVRDSWIVQQLMPDDSQTLPLRRYFPRDLAGELIGSARIDRVCIIDADDDHDRFSRLRSDFVGRTQNQTNALISPAATPHRA